MKPPAAKPSRAGAVLLGIARVARGRKDGLLQFGDTAQAVLGSLAPLVAFLLVGAVLGLVSGSRGTVEYMAVASVILLAPLVVTFEFARVWGRPNQWFRFAAAFCWCQWAGPMVLLAVTLLMLVLVLGGFTDTGAMSVGLACLVIYGLWLNWFLVRHALGVTALRALLVVVCTNIVTTGLVMLPERADYVVNGPSQSP